MCHLVLDVRSPREELSEWPFCRFRGRSLFSTLYFSYSSYTTPRLPHDTMWLLCGNGALSLRELLWGLGAFGGTLLFCDDARYTVSGQQFLVPIPHYLLLH